MRIARPASILASTLTLGACAGTAPTPVVGLPGPGKDIATFQKEDTACRQEASEAARAPTAPSSGAPATGSNAQWLAFFDTYARCENAHGNIVQRVPWAAAYADYLGTSAPPYAYAAYGYGYPYYYGGPFLFGYPYPFFFGVGYGFGYGHFGYGHFGGGFHGGGGGRR